MADLDMRISGEEGTVEYVPLSTPGEEVDVRVDGDTKNAEVDLVEIKATVDSPVFDMSIEQQQIELNISPEMREILIDLTEILINADTERINNAMIEMYENGFVMTEAIPVLVDQLPIHIYADQVVYDVEAQE